jgi:uncharacterized protein YjlB
MTVATAGAGGPHPRLHRVFQGEAAGVRSTPFGEVGTLFSGSGMEVAWVSKHGEEIDPDWFVSEQHDVLVVIRGRLKVEFESAAHNDLVLEVGDALVLPPACRCRAYRWPRESQEATVFLAAYPTVIT